MYIQFNITAGFLVRKSVREQLNNSKKKIEHWYPQSRVLITENRNLFDSEFYFEAVDIPDSAELEMKEWVNKLKKLQ